MRKNLEIFFPRKFPYEFVIRHFLFFYLLKYQSENNNFKILFVFHKDIFKFYLLYLLQNLIYKIIIKIQVKGLRIILLLNYVQYDNIVFVTLVHKISVIVLKALQ